MPARCGARRTPSPPHPTAETLIRASVSGVQAERVRAANAANNAAHNAYTGMVLLAGTVTAETSLLHRQHHAMHRREQPAHPPKKGKGRFFREEAAFRLT